MKIPETEKIVTDKATKIVEAGDLTVLPPIQSPMQIISQAVQRGAGEKELEILERMFAFDIKVKEQQAKEAWHKAMAAFKANPPKIWRDMQVKYGTGSTAQEWSHADLGIAGDAISRGLGEHNLNHTWRTEPQEDGKTKVTCIIAHELGHSESTWLWSDPDKSGSKNSIQAIGSAIFYLERYTLFALSGLAPAHMDDNGQSTVEPEEEINDQQSADITALAKEVGADEAKFCKFLKISSIDKMPISMYERAVKELERKRK